jgi:thymidine phosphorylase
VYRAEGFQALSKVEVRANGRRILATLNVVDDDAHRGCHELGLSEDAFAQLGVPEGHPASVPRPSRRPRFPPAPQDRRRAPGREDFHAIVRDIAEHRYSKIELTAFVVATNRSELDREEVYFLTEAMIASGRRLDWHEPWWWTSTASAAFRATAPRCWWCPSWRRTAGVPKTSSRAITSPAGTADTMEVLANVELPFDRLSDIVREHRGCLAWGGTADLSPADDVLISVERPLSLDSPGQMVASILSKKIAAGSTHLVLDIPIGPTAKVRSMPEAQRCAACSSTSRSAWACRSTW